MATFLRRRWRWVLGAALAGAVLAGGGLWWSWQEGPQLRITEATCAAIQPGMTEADVEALVGGPAGAYSTRSGYYGPEAKVSGEDWAALARGGTLQRRLWTWDHGCIVVNFEETSGRVADWAFYPGHPAPLSWPERLKAYARQLLGL